MITLKSGPMDRVMEFTVTGVVTGADYDQVLIPAVEAALLRSEKLRMLVTFDEGFDRYTMEAMADDAKLGLAHWHGFERVAVVTDVGWMALAIRSFALVMPCPVKVFPLAETEAARDWISAGLTQGF